MGLSISDIDKWNPDALSAVGEAGSTRAAAAAAASASLNGLSVFDSWQGTGAGAAQASTQSLADGASRHGKSASTVARAANTAANEVRQIRTQLNDLRTTLGRYGITVDADGNRAVPPPNLASLPADQQQLIHIVTHAGQLSLDKLRHAADLADGNLSAAIKGPPKGDDFDLDVQYASMPGAVGGEVPAGTVEVTVGGTAITVTVVQITQTKTWWTQPGGSKGRHCK